MFRKVIFMQKSKKLEYIELLAEQYKEATGIKNIDLKSKAFLSELNEWLSELNRMRQVYTYFLDSNNIDYKESSCVEVGKGEYDSVVHGNYGYSPEEVWLTGFPRYDLLENAPEKLVTIMPTWRKYVTTGSIADSIHMTLKPDFQKTKFCRFYSDLLTDQRLLDAAAEYGYKLAFFPHALLMDHIGMFRCSPQIEIVKPDTLYKDIFKRSSLMITDFSSAVFDFAYLHKPVIYAQFDKDLFLAGHYPQGYFDYERDGFGEVEYDLNSTVDRIIEYMKNDCQLKDKYRERINAFFAFHYRHCCDRVFARIAEIAGKPE